MSKNNLRRMMMLRDHGREPERDRLEEERDRRERDLERRMNRLEEENRYYPYPRYPDDPPERMPKIGFSRAGNWDRSAGRYEHGGASSKTLKMPRPHLTRDEAEEWCDSMVNADGTKGAHWTMEQAEQVASQRGITCDKPDFWAIMCMMYSDFCKVAKNHSVDTPGFYADMAKAFLDDSDAVDGKAYAYWDCIADHS